MECLLCPASLLTFQTCAPKSFSLCKRLFFLVEEQLEYGRRASSIAARSLLALPPKKTVAAQAKNFGNVPKF